MRILAINPPIADFAAYDLWAYPIGFLYLLSYLESRGITIDYLDCRDRYHPLMLEIYKPKNKLFSTGPYYKTEIEKPKIYKNIDRPYYLYGMPPEIILKYLKNIEKPDLVLITSMMTYWYPGIITTAKLVKEFFPNTPIILGGIYANLCSEHAKTLPGIDVVVTYRNFDDFFNIINKGNFNDFIESMNYLPPLYSKYKNLKSILWMTSIGCPFKCDVCAAPYLYGKYIPLNIENNAENLIKIIKTRKIKHIAFADDALLLNTDKHFIPFINKIIKNNLNVYFHTPNGLHLKFITLEIAKLMKKANFKTIRLSLESSVSKIQQKMDSKVNNQTFETAVSNLKTAGFKPSELEAYIMMGLPDQDIKEVIESIFYLAKMNIKIVLAAYSPIPHTKLYKEHIKEPIDPLLHNNTYFFHYQGKDIKIFKKLRNLVSLINNSIDRGTNIFSDNELNKFFEIKFFQN